MPVMGELTLKTDVETCQSMHGQIRPVARDAGMLFHSGREAEGGIAVVDFCPRADAFRAFLDGPIAGGMKPMGLEPPNDVKITPVLTADT